jgi:hypothetical protein
MCIAPFRGAKVRKRGERRRGKGERRRETGDGKQEMGERRWARGGGREEKGEGGQRREGTYPSGFPIGWAFAIQRMFAVIGRKNCTN